MPDDIDIKDANDAVATVATKDIGGREFQQMLVSDPADGAAIKPASQADVHAVRDRLPAGGAATEASLAALLAKVIAAPSTEAKQNTIITALSDLLTVMAGASTEATLIAVQALLAREALNNDSEDPATETGLPTEAYGMVYDEVRDRWHRQRGDLARGTKVYQDELLAALEYMNQTLAAIASAMPQLDEQRRSRVLAAGTVGITANSAVSVAQWGGQNVVVGPGAGGNGAPRVTPSNEVVAGSPQLFMLYQSMLAPGMSAFYDRATY